MLFLYNIIQLIFFPFYFLLFFSRLFRKKDDFKSLKERISIHSAERPQGNLVWLYAASVGESIIAITLIDALQKIYPDMHFLITTSSFASGKKLKKSLPKNTIHQFIPIDNLFTVNRFLSYWKPDLGIFIESELWPCLISEASKRFDITIVNARLSDQSFLKWYKHKNLFKIIIDHFKLVTTQSTRDLGLYNKLGCPDAIFLGNLKFANKAPAVDPKQLTKLENILKKKKVFVVASTHLDDEEIIFKILKQLKKESCNYYPIIAPRHPDRRQEIIRECGNLDLTYSLRSKYNVPNLKEDLYIADTFGELGLFYSLADIVFIGNSFKRGGHNLLEPAYFNNIIIVGPDMSNFQDITTEMLDKNAIIQISNQQELYKKIKFFLQEDNSDQAKALQENAYNFINNKNKVLSDHIDQIKKFL